MARSEQPSEVEAPMYAAEAECAIVAGLFSEHGNEVWDHVALSLVSDDFHLAHCRVAVAAYDQLINEELPTDQATLATRIATLVTVTPEMKKQFAEASQFPFSLENVPAYVKAVYEKSRARLFSKSLEGVIAKAGLVGGVIEIDDLAREAESLVQQVQDDAPSKVRLLDTPKEALKRTIDRIDKLNSGALKGIETGIKDIDDALGGFMPQDYVVIGARPSMGKTAFVLSILKNFCLPTSDERPLAAVFSIEMETELLIMRMLSSIGSIDNGRMLKGQLNDEEWPRLSASVQKYATSNIHIDDDPVLTPNILRSKLRMLKRKHGEAPKVVVIDHMILMDADGKHPNRYAEVTEISRMLKRIAKQFNCVVIALCQLNRGVEDRTDKRPRMSDLRESGAIEQDADTVILLYRDEYYNEDSDMKGMAEVIVAKSRNGGGTGTVVCAFTGNYQRFENLNRGYANAA